jgi:dethiobiotin synthetase
VGTRANGHPPRESFVPDVPVNRPVTGFFVTGTDTGVGKTLISRILITIMRRRGLAALGMKPVATDAIWTSIGLRNDDAERLRQASSGDPPYALVNPYVFEPPLAPHLAAEDAGRTIQLDPILGAFRQLAANGPVVVEGVGGWRVPLNPREDTSDLARALGLPVILVVAIRLGCLNHTLLTAAAVRACGLGLAGWVANHPDPTTLHPSRNVRAIMERVDCPLLGSIPYQSAMPDPHALASLLTLPAAAPS